ncbi:hypothetical protein [Singulisphaera sp. PoT]|uniref:hypothetical protein n=1 Tax=Singulisphaera sp. PoT TaxID=3411797 RepID=UPI003BF5FABD
MKYATKLSVFVVALLAIVATANAAEKASSVNAARFEAIKALEGDWVEADKDGKPTNKHVSSFRVTAGGSAVEEKISCGEGNEMITMYTLDGDDLILTHYCVLGNQPRMKAESGIDVSKIPFEVVSVGNLKSKDDSYMSRATFTLIDKDHFKAEWVNCKAGKDCHKVNLDLVRKTK